MIHDYTSKINDMIEAAEANGAQLAELSRQLSGITTLLRLGVILVGVIIIYSVIKNWGDK